MAQKIVDLSGWNRLRGRAEKQVRFAMAVSLTRTGQDCVDEVKSKMPRIFDRPKPYTVNSMGRTRATKQKLVSTVFVKDRQAEYLKEQETGGQQTPTRGKPLFAKPAEINPDKYGNIPRRVFNNLGKAGSKFFVAGASDGLPPGIYQRKGGKKNPTRVFVAALLRIRRYRPIFKFADRVQRHARKRMRFHFPREMRKALASARR